MRLFAHLTVALALLTGAAVSCGGGPAFSPVPAPFSGTFVAASGSVGTFAFTVSSGGLAGSGALVVGEESVTVAISALLNGSDFSGKVANDLIGQGEFSGTFSDASHCSGTFSFTRFEDQAARTGTWAASATP
jgi:hypothetical protein